METYNTTLLKLAREQNGLSQTELANALGVKQALLSKYENGAIVPPEEMQDKIAERLGYQKSFFLQSGNEVPSGLVFHRKRSSLPAKIRMKIEAEARARVLDVIHLGKSRALVQSNIVAREGETPEQMAQRLRTYWGCEHGPIGNLTETLESNGIIIVSFDFGTDKLDGFFLPLPGGIITIALNSDSRFTPDRRRFTLAHELGHAVLEHFNDFPGEACEKEADRFASEFLLPEADVRNDLLPPLTLTKLKELKCKWRVSMQSLVYRAHILGVINDSIYRRTFIYLAAQGFRKHEPLCGILQEKPALLASAMRSFIETCGEGALTELHLTAKVFNDRYHLMEGCSEMSVKAL